MRKKSRWMHDKTGTCVLRWEKGRKEGGIAGVWHMRLASFSKFLSFLTISFHFGLCTHMALLCSRPLRVSRTFTQPPTLTFTNDDVQFFRNGEISLMTLLFIWLGHYSAESKARKTFSIPSSQVFYTQHWRIANCIILHLNTKNINDIPYLIKFWSQKIS